MSNFTYRAVLDGEAYGFIGFFKWHLYLRKVNQRPVNCHECKQDFLPAQCVHHGQTRNNYFICLACAKVLILKHGKRGYHVSMMQNLQCADMMDGRYTAQQVADSIQLFRAKPGENGLDILTPFGESQGE